MTPSTNHHGADRREFLAVAAGALGVAVVTAGCTGDDTDPVAAVESYFAALEDGDRETANSYAHEDGEYYVETEPTGLLGDALEADEIALTGPEEVSLETAVENTFEDTDGVADAIEREREAIETLKDEYGFEDHAYVRHEARMDGLAFNPTVLLFEHDGWLIWSLPTTPPLQVGDR